MGQFNVSCSVSKLPLQNGDKVVAIFLEKSKVLFTERGKIPDLSFFNNSDDLYRPALLPIFGELDDFGGLEEIENDGHVESIKKYFKMSIEDIMEVTSTRHKNLDTDSHFYKVFNIPTMGNKTGIMKENILRLKFTEDNGIYTKVDCDFSMSYKNKENSSQIEVTVNYKNKEKKYSLNDLFTLQQEVYKDFNYILSLSMERQSLFVDTIKTISGFSTMYINRKIYDVMVSGKFDGKKSKVKRDNLKSQPHPFYLELYDFEKEGNEVNIDATFSKKDIVFKYEHESLKLGRETIHEMKDFFDICKKNNITLDENKIKGLNPFKEKLKYSIDNIIKITEGMDEIYKDIRKHQILWLKELITPKSNWSHFIKMYTSILGEGNVSFIDNIQEFYFFFYDLESLNTIFSPTVGGRQTFDKDFLKLIYKKSYSVLNSRKKNKGSFEETLVDSFVFGKKIVDIQEELENMIDEYQIQYVMEYSGMSKFEIELFKKDKNVLQGILESYHS